MSECVYQVQSKSQHLIYFWRGGGLSESGR